jgi:hypothetical protein
MLILPHINVLSRSGFILRNVSMVGGWVTSTSAENARYQYRTVRLKSDAYRSAVDRLYPKVGDGFLGFLVDPNEHFPEHPGHYALNPGGDEVGCHGTRQTRAKCRHRPRLE